MIEFAVTVQGQRISCTKVKGELVSGAKGVKVQFTWSEEWQQLQRIGVFRAGSIARDVMDLQDECVIPWEVLMQPGQVLMIGVLGVNEEGTAVTPTLEAEMGEILRGADPSDDPSTEPALPIWQWVKNLLEQVARLMEHSVLFTKQDLTHSEQAQARDNIGAADSDFVGDSAAALDAVIEMQEALLNASGTKPDDYGTPYAVEYIAQELTESAKAQARKNIGAAPAGYGLGGTAKQLAECDLNTIVENGWYCFNRNAGVTNAPSESYASMLFVENFYNTDFCKQTVTMLDALGTTYFRTRHSGEWTAWRSPAGALGAAPSGYGLGVQKASYVQTLEQLDAIFENGWYVVHLKNDGEHLFGASAGLLCVNACQLSAEQTFLYYGSSWRLTRTWHNSTSTWSEWEWINPPMQLGQEYRTTEKWQNKPVYTMLQNVGSFPSAGAVSYYAIRVGMTKILRIKGTAANAGFSVPYTSTDAYLTISGTVYGDAATVIVYVEKGDLAADQCIAQVWYIKD